MKMITSLPFLFQQKLGALLTWVWPVWIRWSGKCWHVFSQEPSMWKTCHRKPICPRCLSFCTSRLFFCKKWFTLLNAFYTIIWLFNSKFENCVFFLWNFFTNKFLTVKNLFLLVSKSRFEIFPVWIFLRKLKKLFLQIFFLLGLKVEVWGFMYKLLSY